MKYIHHYYPEFYELLHEFKRFESSGEAFSTQHASHYLETFHEGVRRELPYSALITLEGDTFEGKDEPFLCNPNKSSEHTQLRIQDEFYEMYDNFHRNTDFIFSNLYLLSQFSKKKWLQLLCLILFDIDVVVEEGVDSIGRLDHSFALDCERIKFVDDKKYQHNLNPFALGFGLNSKLSIF